MRSGTNIIGSKLYIGPATGDSCLLTGERTIMAQGR
jgi:hypothetical protein